MAGCKEIIKSLGFHIDIFVLKPVYCKEFALHRGWMQTKITSSFSGLNMIPDLGLFPPKIPDRNLSMNGPVFAGYSCCASCEWHFWSCPLSNPAQLHHLRPWGESQLISSWIFVFWRSCVCCPWCISCWGLMDVQTSNQAGIWLLESLMLNNLVNMMIKPVTCHLLGNCTLYM